MGLESPPFKGGELRLACGTGVGSGAPPLEKGRWSGAQHLSGGDQTVSTNGRDRPLPHPLYFAPLAHFCPPEALWASAIDRGEQQDVNTLHYLASARLEDIGCGIRPDPYAGLPDLSCLDPPPPPQIKSL